MVRDIGSALQKKNVFWHYHSVRQQDREKLHRHRSVVLWFTGLSGSGKSTLAGALEEVLYQRAISTYLLDGDNLRCGLCCDLNFTDNDRCENVRRVGEIAKLMFDAGLVVLSTLISPYRFDRQLVRSKFPVGRFVEIFVDTPLSICEKRDPKGLYKKSRIGEIKNFTGVNGKYEKPYQPEIHLNGEDSLMNLIKIILDKIDGYLFI